MHQSSYASLKPITTWSDRRTDMRGKRRCFGPPNVTTPSAATIARNIFPFFRLPPEIRNRIYEHTLDWTYAMDCIANDRPPKPLTPTAAKASSTPGILLANRQFYSEAVVIAYNQTLRIENPRSPKVYENCFSQATLQRLRFVTFDIIVDEDAYANANPEASAPWALMPRRGWRGAIRMLANVWHDGHDLQTLTIKRTDKRKLLELKDRVWPWQDAPMSCEFVEHVCNPLRAVSGVKKVVFEGEVPTWFLSELKEQMESEFGQSHLDANVANNPWLREYPELSSRSIKRRSTGRDRNS